MSTKSTKKNQNRNQPKRQPKPRKAKAPLRLAQPKAPVAFGTVGRIGEPRYKMHKNGKVCVTHAELVGNVQGSAGFQVNSYQINPGLSSPFVWLSSIATNYESYKFKRLKFRFVPTCSTTQVGVIYISVDFDPADPAPQTEQQISAYEGTKYGSAWSRHEYDCLKHNLAKRSSYFVRDTALSAGQDIGLYDVGQFFIATSDNGGTPPLGKLWVEYEVEFETPALVVSGVGRSLSGKYSASDNFATPPSYAGNLPLTASVASNVLTLTSLQSYQGLVGVTVGGTGVTALGTAGSTAAFQIRNTSIASGGANLNSVLTVNFTAPGQTLSLSLTATTVTAYAVRVGQYNNSYA